MSAVYLGLLPIIHFDPSFNTIIHIMRHRAPQATAAPRVSLVFDPHSQQNTHDNTVALSSFTF